MKLFSDLFNFPRGEEFRADRLEVVIAKEAWRKTAKEARLATQFTIVVAVVGTTIGLVWNLWVAALFMLAPLVIVEVVLVRREANSNNWYKVLLASFRADCLSFNAAVVAIKLSFEPGRNRYFVATLFRPTALLPKGGCLHYLTEQANSRVLIDLLARNGLENAVYPELLTVLVRSKEEAQESWQSFLDSVSDMFGTRLPWQSALFDNLYDW